MPWEESQALRYENLFCSCKGYLPIVSTFNRNNILSFYRLYKRDLDCKMDLLGLIIPFITPKKPSVILVERNRIERKEQWTIGLSK